MTKEAAGGADRVRLDSLLMNEATICEGKCLWKKRMMNVLGIFDLLLFLKDIKKLT